MPVVKQCNNCGLHIYNRIIDTNREANDELYFYLCKKCQKKEILISKSECLSFYHIDDERLHRLKMLYFPNRKNLIKYYYRSEIESFNFPLRIKKIRINNERLHRKNELIKTLELNKLKMKQFGDMHNYVQKGYPLIQDIVDHELQVLYDQSTRRHEILQELETYNLQFNYKHPLIEQYINNTSNRSLQQIIQTLLHENKNENMFLMDIFDYSTVKEFISNHMRI
jgi:hypothetical protein